MNRLVLLFCVSSFCLGNSIDSLERFVLASNRSSLADFFIPGTSEYMYFNLLSLIDSDRANSTEFRDLLSKFELQGASEDFERVRMRGLLRQWDSSPEARTDVLSALRSLVSHSHFAGDRPEVAEGVLLKEEPDIPEEAYHLVNVFNTLTPAAYSLLSIQKFDVDILKHFLREADLSEVSQLPETLAEHVKTGEVAMDASIFAKMTLEQTERLAFLASTLTEQPAWIEAVLDKKFPLESSDFASLQTSLEQAAKFLHSISAAEYEGECLRLALVAGLFTGRLEERSFLDYLFLSEKRSSFSSYLKRAGRILPSIEEEELRDEYLMNFLRRKPISEQYSLLFKPAELSRLTARAAALAGGCASDFPHISELAVEVELEIERSSPQFFSASSEVVLSVRRKNVPRLTISIFEINAEEYFKATLSPLKADVDLDGVVPTHMKTLENTDSPLTRVVQKVTFPEISGRAGVFAIEVVGSGRHVRALIRIGGLYHTSLPTPAGYEFLIYRSDGTLLEGASVGVIANGKKYWQEPAKQFVLLPFPQSSSTKELILVADGIAELVSDFEYDSAYYELKLALFVQTEGLVSGEQVTVLASLRLFINGFAADLSGLENASAEVMLTDSADRQTSKTFPDLLLRGKEATVALDFEVPPGITRLRVKVTAEAAGEQLSAYSSLSANNLLQEPFDIYLRAFSEQDHLNYEIHAMGRDGEALASEPLRVSTRSIYATEERTRLVSTDAEGVVHLAALTHTATLRVTVPRLPAVSREWDLAASRATTAYPEQLAMSPGEVLELPVVPSPLGTAVSLTRVTADSSVVWRASLTPASGVVTLQGLAEGTYELKLPGQSDFVRCTLRVVAGAANTEVVGIRDVAVGSDSLSVQLSGAGSGAKVRVLMRHFEDEEVARRWSKVTEMRGKSLEPQLRTPAKSLFSRGGPLDAELRYIYDRKTATGKRGISFPLPSLLLKPKEVEHYRAASLRILPGLDYDLAFKFNLRAMHYGNPRFSANIFRLTGGSFYDFLFSPAAVVEGTADSSGLLRVLDRRISAFSLFEVVATSGDAAAQICVHTQRKQLGLRAVALPASCEDTKLAEVRKVQPLRAAQTAEVTSLSKDKFAAIDTVGRLLDVLLRLTAHSKSEDWLFLARWERLSVAEKETKLSKFFSHELNLFLFYKDRAFFESAVRPALANKLEKSFMDDFLLGSPLDKYLEFEQLTKMPVPEKALLALVSASETLRTSLRQVQSEENWIETTDSVLRISVDESASRRDSELHPWSTVLGKQTIEEGKGGEHKEVGSNLLLLLDSEDLLEKSTPLYKQLDTTREYAETQYFDESAKDGAVRFWSDIAQGDFLPRSVFQGRLSLGEVVMAIALVELPWQASAHSFAAKSGGYTMRAGSNCYLFHKDIQPAPQSPLPFIAAVQYFSDPENSEADVEEFVPGRVYKSHVVVSNLSRRKVKSEVLLKFPQGSVPLGSFQSYRVEAVSLEAHNSSQFEVSFYFPRAGRFAQTSASVVIGGELVQWTPYRSLDVRVARALPNSLPSLVRANDTTGILQFLSVECLENCNRPVSLAQLSDLLSSSKSFFLSVTAVLRSRLIFSESVWASALLHETPQELREWLQHRESVRKAVGSHFRSSLLSTEREQQRHLEYFPLVNARAKQLGDFDRITNRKFRDSYRSFLQYLAEKPSLTAEDRVCLAQYFVLQGRFEEAQEQLQLAPDTFLRLQFDYLSAYLNSTAARSLVPKYVSYPLLHWREKFSEVSRQLQEADGQVESPSEQILSVSVDQFDVRIYSQHLASATVSLYPIDLEVVFSRSPFLSQSMGACRYTAAVHSEAVNLTSHAVVSYRLPESLRLASQFITVESQDFKWSHLYLNSGLRVQHWDCELRVTEDSLRPVKNAYVKVYGKMLEEVHFHKDGYTDERGKFDFVRGGNEPQSTAFAILVSSPSLGALVLEVKAPPK